MGEAHLRNIEVGFEGDDRTRVYVKLVAIKKPLAPGTYRTVVRMGEVPIAEVLIVVQEKKSFTAEVTRVVPQGPGGDRPRLPRSGAQSHWCCRRHERGQCHPASISNAQYWPTQGRRSEPGYDRRELSTAAAAFRSGVSNPSLNCV